MKSNNGGRNRFTKNTIVRYITVQGSISEDEYYIDPDNPNDSVVADRKGLITIRSTDGKRELRIQSRRILPSNVGNRVPVIESGNKYRAVCNKCQNVLEITGAIENITCGKCQAVLPLFWIGEKPMNEMNDSATATTDSIVNNVPKVKAKSPKSPKPKAEKKMTTTNTKEVQKIDLSAIAKNTDLELWTKKSVKFDHVEVDVQAHALLFIGNNPRKLCFNTYDGALGKKASSLPIEAFIADQDVTTSDKAAHKPWFYIKDLEKARAQLKKNGYEKA